MNVNVENAVSRVEFDFVTNLILNFDYFSLNFPFDFSKSAVNQMVNMRK